MRTDSFSLAQTPHPRRASASLAFAFLLTLSLFACFCFGTPAARAAEAGGGKLLESRLAQSVPENSILFFALRPEAKDAPPTAFRQILASPRVDAAVRPLFVYLQGLDGLAALQAGLGPYALLRSAEGGLYFALAAGTETPFPRFALQMELGEYAATVENALPALELFLRQRLRASAPPEGADGPVRSLTLGAAPLSWLVAEKSLFLGYGPDALGRFAVEPEEGFASLAAEPSVRRLVEKGRLGPGGWAVCGNLPAFFDWASRVNPFFPPQFHALARQHYARRFWMSSTPRGAGYLDVHIQSDIPPASVLRQLFDREPLSGRHARLAPAAAEYFLSLRLVPDQAWEAGWKYLTQAFAAAPRFLQQIDRAFLDLQELEKKLGFRMIDLGAALGPEFSLSSGPDGSLVAADLKDPGAFAGCMAKLDAHLGPRASRSLSYGSYTIRYFNRTGLPLPVAPAYTVRRGVLLVAPWPHTLKEALKRLDAPEFRSLAETPDYKRVMAEVAPGSLAEYFRAGPALVRAADAALPFLHMTTAIPLNPFDPGKLPPPEVFAEKLFGHARTARWEGDDLVQEIYGPLGTPDYLALGLDCAASWLEGPFGGLFLAAIVEARQGRADRPLMPPPPAPAAGEEAKP